MDKHEEIMQRIVTLLEAVDGVVQVKRNDPTFAEVRLPGVLVLDGDEEVEDAVWGKGRPPNGPARVTAYPEIYVVLPPTTQPANVGNDLHEFKRRIVASILNDADLRGMCVDGDIRYEGTDTALALGRAMVGEMGIKISFRYVPDFTVEPVSG